MGGFPGISYVNRRPKIFSNVEDPSNGYPIIEIDWDFHSMIATLNEMYYEIKMLSYEIEFYESLLGYSIEFPNFLD